MAIDLYDRILGAIVGGTIGDALGGVVEFRNAEQIQKLCGGDWVAEFLPYAPDHGVHPVGVWEPGPPRGTGTDDTRNNQVFVECVIRNGGAINSQLLAVAYLERYRDRERFYPRHVELAEKHFRSYYRRACAHLGMSELPDGTPAWALHASGAGFPTLTGLISLAPAGLLHAGEPEKAYRKAYELAFCDLGFARDATARLAAMVSAALGEGCDASTMVRVGLETAPFGVGRMSPMNRLKDMVAEADRARDDRDLVQRLAHHVERLHPFDPLDLLGVSMAAVQYTDGDPQRSLFIAANDRNLDEDGRLKQLRDVDCVAGIAGAMVGALRGAAAFPEDWVRDTVEANRKIYDIDLEANARRFMEVVYG